MPITKLFGRSPAGLNATGESDLENWYGEVLAYQQHVIKPRIERIVRLICYALGMPDPESWSVTFPSLWIEGPKAIAERRKIIADTDKVYIDAGVYEAEEVALARAQGPDAEIVIDEDSRRTQLELDRSQAWKEEQEPTTPVPPQPPAPPQPLTQDEEAKDEAAPSA
jgi:hypothetical protein